MNVFIEERYKVCVTTIPEILIKVNIPDDFSTNAPSDATRVRTVPHQDKKKLPRTACHCQCRPQRNITLVEGLARVCLQGIAVARGCVCT